MRQFIEYVTDRYPSVNIVVNEDVAQELIDSPNINSRVAAKGSTIDEQEEIADNRPETGSGDVVVDKFTALGTSHNLIPIYTGSQQEIVNKTDLIVTLGGDGTILRAVSMFSGSSVPPILLFALGTLGFLLPFDFKTFEDSFAAVYQSRAKVLHRTRLECHIIRKQPLSAALEKSDIDSIRKQEEHEINDDVHGDPKIQVIRAMNDISLHRGGQPNLCALEIYIDNEFLTTTTADGVIFATPTGSTAYSLSAGGSITHPLVPCILLTPICPRSLLFRPLLLPLTSHVMIKFSERNRNVGVRLNIDGIPQNDLRPGDQIHVVSENGTIFIKGEHEPPKLFLEKSEFDHVIEPGGKGAVRNARGSPVDDSEKTSGTSSSLKSNTNKPSKGIWCVARSQNDWTKDINELLGFNSSFRASAKGASEK
ncbi:NADH kinase pos5 [Scheffersomyces spartinae]|uniref:NADH kinase pos5 n=1 Tax=Scheffersomyces spartinae TaxID=45513 RepID=A0A9P8AIV7_9ASCO|nr:NADH kinase pos5 [Scheffersomyces spartinae]KAG7193531.1 NADH kinase pos5 [Scheffersomyces spartinae]